MGLDGPQRLPLRGPHRPVTLRLHRHVLPRRSHASGVLGTGRPALLLLPGLRHADDDGRPTQAGHLARGVHLRRPVHLSGHNPALHAHSGYD